ncbi:MAG: sodium-dependent transporter [Candidatus Hydrogenedentes bacterium]|nr:sodium-dependent transporter [Candidatus Hydrogenedentota bacterium]
MANGGARDRWVTRFGLVMAMAGNAVGLGNFLRFPGKAAAAGGAFMVPYLLALVLLGIPLMWIEWSIGRHGGRYGHGSTPGMFHRLWKHPISKYLGIFGVVLPAIIGIYYIYIESWSLGYAWHTLMGDYWGKTSREEMKAFADGYRGIGAGTFAFSPDAYLFFLITFGINILVFARGISKGIEILCKYAMPTLAGLGVVLAIRVLTLPPLDGRTVSDGLAQLYVVDWSKLGDAGVWISATGQVFFSLSLGFGMIHTYASYLKKEDDIVASGLTAASTNEFVEVILGGTIAIPAAVIFFGVAEMRTIAQSTFDIGFQTMPVIFQQLPLGRVFGAMWFVLLFLAGLTSSVAMFTPLLQFLQDELDLKRRTGVIIIGLGSFLLMQPVVLFLHHGILDELDFWAGDFGLVLFAAIELVVFAWIFGMKKGWEEIHFGADFRVPGIFYYVMLIVTPLYTLGLLAWWLWYSFPGKLWMTDVNPADVPYLWLGRGMIVVLLVLVAFGVRYAWRTHPKYFEEKVQE